MGGKEAKEKEGKEKGFDADGLLKKKEKKGLMDCITPLLYSGVAIITTSRSCKHEQGHISMWSEPKK